MVAVGANAGIEEGVQGCFLREADIKIHNILVAATISDCQGRG